MDRARRRARRADGIDLIMPDWFYRAVLDDALVLTIDPAYFGLTGGLERWLYRLVRKHAGRQRTVGGSIFAISTPSRRAFRRSSASPSSCATSRAASPCRAIGLSIERASGGRPSCSPSFAPAQLSTGACGQSVEPLVLSGTDGHVPSGTGPTCYQEPEAAIFHQAVNRFRRP